jgi:hypothetical protein
MTMSDPLLTASAPTTTPAPLHRKVLVAIETAMAVFGLGGGIMLIAGQGTPPVAAISSLGLSAWVVPGLWLTASVAVPSGTAAYLAWRGSSWTPRAVLLASGLLAVELLVQVPFLGVNGLQVAMATIGGTAAALAWRGRHTWGPAFPDLS